MSEVIWKINGTPASELGITVAGGTFRTQGISYALLDAARDFDAPQILTHGSPVIISRTLGAETVIVFQGRVAPISKHGSPEYEGHAYPIEDAWAELESTTYQEPWALGTESYLFPRAVLGIRAVGDDPETLGGPLTIGEQIAAIITYAISVGVNLQMGSTPGGEILWPKEVNNISCSEAINQTLELHPDWIPWLDHSTTPPTFHVSDAAMMGTVSLDVNGGDPVTSFTETRRDDLIPAAVRIVYEYATTIDDEVYRNAVIDKFPAAGPEGGPRVLCATIPLAGGQMQMQKSRIRVRPMPDAIEEGGEDEGADFLAKKWVKANYPHLYEVDLEEFEIKSFKKTLHVDDLADNPDPQIINMHAERLVAEDLDDVPNQLVEGTIEDWMRRRVGWVNFAVEITPAAECPPEKAAIIARGTPPGRCVCTNAVTKLYKGITQWSAEEDMPVGIAAGVYHSAAAAYQFEGEVTLREAELSGTVYHGQKLTLSGADTTGAVIHSVTWDLGTGETTLGFGPVPELAPADFVELQRRLRARTVTWWNKEERKDNKLGCEKNPSAAGDTVAGYHYPQIIFAAADPKSIDLPFSLTLVKKEDEQWVVSASPGLLRRLDNGEKLEVVGTYDSEDEDTEYPVVDNDSVWIEVTIASGVPTLAEIKVGAEWPGHPKLAKYADTEPYSQEKSIILLGKIIEDAASEATPKPLIVTDAVPGNRMLVQGVVNGKLAWVGINA